MKRSLFSIAAVAALFFLPPTSATSADLGGSCCADLEERIAELEATTARKGGKKVSLSISGQISKSLMYVDEGGESDFSIIENSAAESLVRFDGRAAIMAGWSAGYALEIGVGGFGDGEDGGSPVGANDLYVRKSFVYVESPAGRVGIGRQSQATDGIAEMTTANTAVAARKLSLRPINGPEAGDALDLWDGTRADVVRYDSPAIIKGLVISAAWSPNTDDDSDIWDVAIRYAGEEGGFRFTGGVGYRVGVVVPGVGSGGADDVKVFSGSASLMHITSGLFVSGAYGQLDPGAGGNVTGWHLQGGIEQAFLTSLGKTTLFAEYADADDIDTNLYGGGIVQAIDAAALDLYVSGRRVEVEDGEATLIMAGARVKF